jgi:hypothetical protein
LKRSIENILDELIQISGDPLFQKIDILDMTTSVLKARLVIDTDIYIQIYENVRKPKASYTLIVGNNRFYGRDMREGFWHRHPIDDPEIHDDSEEASRSITISEFVQEVKGILIHNDLI